MKNVFIAIGGSGTKVAEALVRLLTVGFPTQHNEKGELTSAGQSLTIWRVDPDRNSGAAEDLKSALDDYAVLQGCLSHGNQKRTMASSRWAMDVLTEIIHLDPLELPKKEPNDNKIKTLDGILNSRYGKVLNSRELLLPFYKDSELNVLIDKGFYQKPFIGSAVMAIFSQSLQVESSPAGEKASLTAYENTGTNFFLCGSLHGGTGACGVPVMAQFLQAKKKPEWGWKIGGCLMAPYFTPPKPPFEKLTNGDRADETKVREYVRAYSSHPSFEQLNPEQKEILVKQILDGFYAEPDEMILRARHGLDYYQSHGTKHFDELYLVSKSSPNKLKYWSNGGSSQRNPLNSAEVVAAITALNFFAKANSGDSSSYVIASSNREVKTEDMKLSDLPLYEVGQRESIEPEKVFLATALVNHLVMHQIPWDKMRGGKGEMQFCKRYDGKDESQITADKAYFQKALNLIQQSIQILLKGHEEPFPTGWSPEILAELKKYFSANESEINEVKSRLEKKSNWRPWADDKGPNRLGESLAKFNSFEFSDWCPSGDYTNGDYLRFVWNKVYQKCEQQLD
jgi:hypothetical protein